MKRILHKYLIASLCLIAGSTFAAASGSNGKPEQIPDADAKTASSVPAKDNDAPESVSIPLNETVSSLKTQLGSKDIEISKLKGENESLKKAISISISLAEKTQGSVRLYFAEDLARNDTEGLAEYVTNFLQPLSPYSELFAEQADSINRFIGICDTYCKYLDFDTATSNVQSNKELKNKILQLYDEGNGRLNEGQLQQINTLYKSVSNYPKAVADFNTLIANVDKGLDDYRKIEGGDNICREDFNNRILPENKVLIDNIRQYRYLSTLLDKYCSDIRKNPKSGTEDIRKALNEMLSEGNAEATEQPTAEVAVEGVVEETVTEGINTGDSNAVNDNTGGVSTGEDNTEDGDTEDEVTEDVADAETSDAELL